MIAINDLTYEIGSRALYDEANWHIKPGEKIGLIGANGTGKTTLLRLIVGEYTPTGGGISYAKEVKIGYLNQDMLSIMTENSILHVAMEAFARQNKLHDEIELLLKKLETDHSEDIIHKLSDRQHEFELLDGYNIQYKAEEILAGLGFTTKDVSRPLKEFSGGWRMRVMLAKILLQEPDLLLLDEPTNHLDLPSIKWLENYLGKFSGAFVIVSHDRYFLDRTVTKIVESKSGQLIEYSGNYSFYLDEKAEREELQRNRFKNQQQQIKQEKQLIDRFRAKASKAKMVQSRIKALDKMEKVEDVDGDAPIVNFKFSFSKHSGKTLVELDNISKSYPGIDLLEKTSAMINRGDKIALIGANGKGKSTLLRIATGLEKCEGKVTEGYNVTKAFYAQHQLEDLDLNKSILDEMLDFAPTYTEKDIRSLLGCFLFSGDDAFKKIKVLSGGEKSRVALAKTLTMDANFLILDEPTNHLDMQSVNILIQALQQYQGTFILVSHDRYLVQNVANTIWYIENKEIKEYPGSYEEYEYWSEQQKKEESGSAKNGKPAKSEKAKKNKQSSSQADNSQANSLSKLKKQLADLEDEIALNESVQKNIENELAKEAVFSMPEKLNDANARYNKVKATLSGLNAEWERMARQIMELEN